MGPRTGSTVFPLDGEDTADVVTIIASGQGETTTFPRRWQTPEGVLDLNEVLLALNQQDTKAHYWHKEIIAYYKTQAAFMSRVNAKLAALFAAAKGHDFDQVAAINNSFTPAECEHVEATIREILAEHPEFQPLFGADSDQ